MIVFTAQKNKTLYLKCLIILLILCNIGVGLASTEESARKYENETFSLLLPSGYYVDEPSPEDDIYMINIYNDILDKNATTITWEVPGTFPGSVSDFVLLFTAKEIEEYETNNVFYNVLEIDSTYTVDKYPAYTTVSVYEEGNDTIMQSRTGLIIPNKCDMMIIQRINTKKSFTEVQTLSRIIDSMKIK